MITLMVVWYLIGFIGGMILLYMICPKIKKKDVLFLMTFGGVGGMITVSIGLYYLLKKMIEKRIREASFPGKWK